MPSWSSEFSDALVQAAIALRVLSDIYDAKKPMNLWTFNIELMENTNFTQALLTTSTALYSLSTTFNTDRFPPDGEVIEHAWNSESPNDTQPPPFGSPSSSHSSPNSYLSFYSCCGFNPRVQLFVKCQG
ncbi:hypothetical protein VKT23_001397 [Stygiomarasmius scandens]|uniref:Uncharacterized protein n=1 Tax=Marasmiellus scandens TaxID=2682957 RepID=A0ABR1K067_9AGAR